MPSTESHAHVRERLRSCILKCMPELEAVKTFVTFRQLGGFAVTPDVIRAEIERWPLDGILGFLALRSIEAVHAGPDFADPRRQGHYLNLAIVDDFPVSLPGAYKMYSPGRVPFTGGHHVLLHEQNMAWLAHSALLHARDGADTPELRIDLQSRMSRLLLIANDLFSSSIQRKPTNLSERRALVLDWLRHGQFNTFFEHSAVTLLKLARQRILMLDTLPAHFPAVEAEFLDATGGVSLERYFQILALFVAFVHNDMGPDKHWLSKERLCAGVRARRDEIECILQRWVRTPEEYRDAWVKWRRLRPAGDDLPGYDFVPLRETPLIEARPGEMVCPVASLLLAKIEDEPYFILSDHLKRRPKELRRFFKALGDAYQAYAGGLVDRIAQADRGGAWWVCHNPRSRSGAELADSYIQRGSIAVTFEHKGQRPGTDFLRGGEGDRVLGPEEPVITKLQNEEHIDLREGRDHDNGFLTKGMWQQSITAPSLQAWAEKELGTRPKRVYPVITHIAPLRPDRFSRAAYLHPLTERGRLYRHPLWRRPQWMHVGDLEGLAALAEQGLLNLEDLLQEKWTQGEAERFDVFLFNRFGSKLVDQRLRQAVIDLLRGCGVTFFDEDVSATTATQ